ncbi:MerR family transcriptional regulator [Gryllotalpicola reticulitermitis]|uniref:MerR family transcriptional regulator n=1 Tax=Gryllotalpicola reticulitermitis TaxID=1184153 RepID=A0ABV8PZW3_9MICO
MGTLSIGDFSRATLLGVTALRHYHRVGLLVPAAVDEATGYRRYSTQQIEQAVLIKRLRQLRMPLDRIRELLEAGSVSGRSRVIQRHRADLLLERADIQNAITELETLLAPEIARGVVSRRSMPEVTGLTLCEEIAAASVVGWLSRSLGRLSMALRQAGAHAVGPAVGIFEDALFTRGSGTARIVIPSSPTRAEGSAATFTTPAVELCVIAHSGPHTSIGRSYAALGAHVAEQEVSAPGPIREVYLVGPLETDDEAAWITEICWPVRGTDTADEARPS